MPLYAGTSGFSYPAWRGSFYPPDARASELLAHYAARLPSVELHGAFRRLPPEEQFRRWAAQTPPGFRFAVKMSARIVAGYDLAFVPVFSERVRALGERLGPVLVQFPEDRMRDDSLLDGLLGALDPGLRHAFELRHPSWNDPSVASRLAAAGTVLVGDRTAVPFRYLRLREPPYSEARLVGLARDLRPAVEAGLDVHCYFKHEDRPRGAGYAVRLVELVG